MDPLRVKLWGQKHIGPSYVCLVCAYIPDITHLEPLKLVYDTFPVGVGWVDSDYIANLSSAEALIANWN